MIKPDSTLVLNNADVNELYSVQISGLWGSSSLLHTHCSSSYIKTDGHCLRLCCKLVHKASTVTFSSTHIAWVINRQDQIKTKRKRRKNTFLLCQFCLPGNESLNKYCHFSGDSIGFEVVPHSPYNLALAPSDFQLFTAFRKHLKGIHVTCDEEIQAAMGKWFWEQSQCRVLYRTLHRLIHTTCLVLAALFRTRRTQHWRVRYCTKYTFWTIFCVLFHYSTLSGCKNTNMKALISVHLTYYAPGVSQTLDLCDIHAEAK